MEGMEGAGPSPAEQQASSELKIQSHGRSLPSIDHPAHNEDAIAHNKQEGFAALFDGMGGQQNGELASRVARTSLADSLKQITTSDLETAKRQMNDALIEASKKVGQEAKGGGTTAVVVKFIDGNKKAIIGSVGDSRAYIQRGDRLIQLTEDDNAISMRQDLDLAGRKAIGQKLDLVATQADLDVLPEQERNEYKRRNQIAQALDGSTVKPHVYPVQLQEGDRLILTSDGIHDNLTQTEIDQLVKTTPPDRMADALAEAAQTRSRDKSHIRSKSDDTSALVITVGSESNVSSPTPPRADALQQVATPEPMVVNSPREALPPNTGNRTLNEWYNSWVQAGGDPREMIPVEVFQQYPNPTPAQAEQIFSHRRIKAGSEAAIKQLFATDAQVGSDWIKVGEKVRVQRSDGRIDPGWEVIGYRKETGAAIVSKDENGRGVTKDIPPDELRGANAANPESFLRQLQGSVSGRSDFQAGDEVKIRNSVVGLSQNPSLTPEQAKQLVQVYAEYNNKVNTNDTVRNYGDRQLLDRFDAAMKSLFAKQGRLAPQKPWW